MSEHPNYAGIGDVFIDAHGPGHGLMVASDGETVTIHTYGEFSEANAQTGRWEGVYEETSVDIRELFRPDAPHLKHADIVTDTHPDRSRKADIIINAALAWLSYWGCSSDDTTIVDIETDGGSCGYFSEYWPGTEEKHLRCELCEAKRAQDLAFRVCEYAYAKFYIVEKASGKAVILGLQNASTPYGTSKEADTALENNPHMDLEHFQVIDGRWLNPCALIKEGGDR